MELVIISVHESTIRKTLNRHGVHGRTPQKAAAPQKKTSLRVWSLPKSTSTLHNTTGKMFCGLMKLRLNYLGRTCSATYGVKRALHTNMKTSSQRCITVEGASWFGAALLPRGLDSLPSSREKWIPKFIKISYRIMSGWLSASWSSAEVGWCSRTMTLNIEVNLLQNGFKKRKSDFWSGPVRAQTVTQ